MKNLLLLIFSILTCCKLLSQTTDENVFTVRTISKEEMVVTGSFQVDVQITANLNCTIDNLNTVNQGSFLSVSPFNTQSAQSSLSVGTYLNANQTMTLTIYITHSTSNLPYYPEDIGVKIKGHTNTTVFEAYAGSKIYFTPYNSVEIWDRIDYRKLPRVWAVKASTPPSRVFIPRDSIPVSTKPVNAQIDYDWQKYYQVAHVDGLPYLIQMAAVHPDTIKYYKDLDSITEWNSEYGKGVFGRTFEGTVSGRLRANYIPDGQTTPINMSLEGVHVAAYDEDITYDDKLGGTHTDANGNFSISYSKWQSKLELDKIELYVQYWSENLGYDIEVEIDHDGIVGLNVAPESDHTWIGQVGTSYTGNLGDISIEGIYEGSFKTLNWAYKAYKFCKNNLGNLNSSFTSSLDILTERNISGSGQFNTVKGNRISLSRNSDLHEGTIWHEFGHFLMHKLQGGYNPGNTIDYDRWGDSHINAAWSEGWADGFAMIVDINYRYYDSESGFRRNAFLNDPVPFEERAIYNATIGFKSVYQIGCTLLDLYDGPNNFLNLPNIATSVYNDESSTGYNSITPNAKDDVSLPFEMLCNAMLFNDHVGQFYTALQNQQTEECIRAKIKRVFTFNGITNPVNAYTNQIAQLNSDFFYTIAYIDGRTFNMDVAVLNTSFNYGATSTYQSAEITDDLKLANGITLGINNNMPIGFGGSGNPSQHTNMYVHACGNTITVENGGVLELGGTNKGGELTLKDGATLILKQGSKLKLNLNAKLLLNNATLVYENGADITISDNAFIEIGEGSKIVIGNNATFSWTGDGYLKFNRNATSTFVPNIIASSSNNGATFDQVNAGGSTKKVIEITKGSLAVDKDSPP